MRKYVALGAVAALGLFPSAALAGGAKYEGDFSGAGQLSFLVEKREAGKKVVRFKFRDLVVNCGGVPKLTAGKITFAISVTNQKFETQAVVGNDPNNPKSKLVLKGELNQNKANGTLRVFGSAVNVGGDPPERDECDSGTVDWDAKR